MKIRTRITLFVLAAGLASSILISVWLICELLEQPFMVLDTSLHEEAQRIVRFLGKRAAENPENTEGMDVSGAIWLEARSAEDGRVLYSSALARSLDLESVKTDTSDNSMRGTLETVMASAFGNLRRSPGKHLIYRVRDFEITHENRAFHVRAARSMEKLDEEIREIFWTAVSGFIFAALILTAMGYAVARKILRPIEKMRELAQNISDKNLAQRVPAGKERDELSDFADTLNLMLDRLQLSFTKQKEFLFDTSHELKTPLSTMRLAVEDLCGSAEIIRMPEDKRQNLFRLENQILRMERLVKNLLDLSSFEALHSVKFNSISVAGLLQPLIDEYRFLAEANGIQMEADLPCGLTFQGDAEKMRRAFSNVLDNAVKYNSDAGDSLIRIKATGSRDAVTVVISNTGDAVPKDEFAKIFDQFYRVDKSRSLLKGGSGLGLAIVKKIAELHGGEVKFESVLDGQRNMNHLTMSFPNLKR